VKPDHKKFNRKNEEQKPLTDCEIQALWRLLRKEKKSKKRSDAGPV